MEKAKLAIIKAEIDNQIDEIKKIYEKIEERKKKKDEATLESMGYQLHNLYCVFEDLFKIAARTFENQIEERDRYHIELLKRMSMQIEGIRPALITKESYQLFDTLRAFRHFFRHAYTQSLDERKLWIVLVDALQLKELYEEEVKRFLSILAVPEKGTGI